MSAFKSWTANRSVVFQGVALLGRGKVGFAVLDTSHESTSSSSTPEGEMNRIVSEEERVLQRVHRTLQARAARARKERTTNYDAELVSLRDQIAEARLEDVPPLVEEMERLQQVAARRAGVTEGLVDPAAPYFGRMVLEENEKKREVLIGRATFLDPTTGIRIVDWRDAPVSRLYYRYEEGDPYEETFGGRYVEGEILVRRALGMSRGELRRISSPQGTFLRSSDGWKQASVHATRLKGGQGTAMRPEAYHRPGKLGVSDAGAREDKHLAEITALLDPRQFDLISRPTAGLVVIQGGAGSGKTTIGLHRLAYLAFQEPRRFASENMLVVVFNDALVRYISRVLPSLGVHGVLVTTFEKWAHQLRSAHVHGLPVRYSDETPSVVVRFKKHPAMLRLINETVSEFEAALHERITSTAAKLEGGAKVIRSWNGGQGLALKERRDVLKSWLIENKNDEEKNLPVTTRHAIERVLEESEKKTTSVIQLWAELLTDAKKIADVFRRHDGGEGFSEKELREVQHWTGRRCTTLLNWLDEAPEDRQEMLRERDDSSDDVGIDGLETHEVPALDREDDALLLRIYQRLEGRLRRKREPLKYEHVFVDEAQDLSPVELSAVLDTVSDGQSVTLAGDVAQRLLMDNGFTDWRHVLRDIGVDHVEVEPLKLSYRSTHEIVEFAREVLGPLRDQATGEATRHGAPIELFAFGDSGEAVAFLAEALRDLAQTEPLASVALICRYPEQADLYYKGLRQAEVPHLRRIAEQDFPFRPGIDVTDVTQVKGLEFDYVVLLEVSTASYPAEDEARHLLHIAATRAAHQLWVSTTGTPSKLLPPKLLEQVI